jgi:hypothetical protein
VSAFETRISGPKVPLADSGAAAPASSGRSLRANVRPCPGSTTPQPNRPSVKRAKSMLERTGSPLPIRVTCPSLPSALTTASEIVSGGPST